MAFYEVLSGILQLGEYASENSVMRMSYCPVRTSAYDGAMPFVCTQMEFLLATRTCCAPITIKMTLRFVAMIIYLNVGKCN